jgi:dTDP-4-amino-4,6-dideoxygalactose transaminase
LADVSIFSSYQVQFYASGTAALASAFVSVLEAREDLSPSAQSEVIFPAYGCPDLISAAEFSGIKPILVDLDIASPWLDLSQIESAITANTVAIVAVNLFGIGERWSQLREVADRNKLVLIEDSAQFFPAGKDPFEWQGDMVVLSFGRGKPVSVLGGGAVLTKNTSLYKCLPKPAQTPATPGQRLLFRLKATIYNAMVSPYLYWLPQALPFLHLGETRYHPLLNIEAMDAVRLEVLAANISSYQNDHDAIARCEKISSIMSSLHHVRNLPLIGDSEEMPRLLRYPLLLEESSRDRVYKRLQQAGLGVSTMYQKSLPKISGLSHLLDDGQHFKNAEEFASRLITLPTHARVSTKDVEKMEAVIRDSV